MLNPSTADADVDDPTIRKCISFARRWEYDELIVVNLFAFRTPSPKTLWLTPRPIGLDNNSYLLGACHEASKLKNSIICAWGTHGIWQGRDKAFMKLARNCGIRLEALRINKTGTPAHPLYVPLDTSPVPYDNIANR